MKHRDGEWKTTGAAALPAPFEAWFRARSWHLRPHQLELMRLGLQDRPALLIALTGGGKTLGGFLATLVELAARPPKRVGPKNNANAGAGLHTLYISPLNAARARAWRIW